ncbi:MAG: hypothetical protein CMN30_03035 [Sandaracinus sp.]|nr:hypothetical protein [Sandaracinus sp.]
MAPREDRSRVGDASGPRLGRFDRKRFVAQGEIVAHGLLGRITHEVVRFRHRVADDLAIGRTRGAEIQTFECVDTVAGNTELSARVVKRRLERPCRQNHRLTGYIHRGLVQARLGRAILGSHGEVSDFAIKLGDVSELHEPVGYTQPQLQLASGLPAALHRAWREDVGRERAVAGSRAAVLGRIK